MQTTHPSIPSQLALLTVATAERLGADKAAIFEQVPFAESRLHQDDSRLDLKEMHQLIKASLILSNCPWLGLEVGRAETVSTWGMLGYALMSCKDEIEAIRIGMQYYKVGPSLMDISAARDGDRSRLVITPIDAKPDLVPFCVEETICGVTTVASSYLSEPLRPLEIWLSYPRPAYADKYDAVFGCPIKYEQDENILWTRAPTRAPLNTSDPVTAQLCLKLVEQVAAKHASENHIEQQIRDILLKHPREMPQMQDVAAALAVSVRTLRRRLSASGKSFRVLQNEVKRDISLGYLRDTQLSVDQIAHLVGFTETTNFRRAFRAWTGHAPTFYRKNGFKPDEQQTET